LGPRKKAQPLQAQRGIRTRSRTTVAKSAKRTPQREYQGGGVSRERGYKRFFCLEKKQGRE